MALTGSLVGGLTGLLWGGVVRVMLLHHATFCINSLCHFFGRRSFATGDESRNLAWLAPFAFGEAWHNNHHAFPTSARHGLGRWQFDPSAWLIVGLERCHLAWEVVRVSAVRQQARRTAGSERSPRRECCRSRLRTSPPRGAHGRGHAGRDAARWRFVLAGRRDEFVTALAAGRRRDFAVTVLLQIVALLSRSEAWHLSVEAAGGTVERRVLYRASSMQVVGSVLNSQLGVAARIAALRRSSPASCPHVPTLIAAEFPILAIEATLAALASFTLVGPLGLPWWAPAIGVAVLVVGERRAAAPRVAHRA